MIVFNEIPKDLLTPGGYIEFDPSRAGNNDDQAVVLIIGQKTAEGSAETDKIYDIGSESDSITLAGGRSISHHMASLFLKYNFSAQLKLACVAVQGTATRWPITFSNATENGIASLIIAGVEIIIPIDKDDTANQLAEKMNVQISLQNVPVNVEVDADTLILTAIHNGLLGNDITVSIGDGNVMTLGEMTVGEGSPDLSSLIENMGDDQYDYIINPYTDEQNLSRLSTEAARRWTALVMRESRVFMSARQEYAEALSFTAAQNTSHFTFIPIGKTIQPAYVWTSIIAAVAISKLGNDPAAPLGDSPLPALIPAEKQFTDRERNTLLHNGASSFKVVAGKVYISYLVTMYQLNAQEHDDTAYRDIQVPETLKRMRRIQIYEVMKTYSGYKIAADASVYAAGQKIMDPDELKGFLYQLYRDRFQREYGWVQDDLGYLHDMITEIDPDNHDRMNFVDHPRLVGQFRVLAGKTQFLDK